MFMDYPLIEGVFRVVVWVVIGIPIAILIISIGSFFITIKLTALFLMWGVFIAFVGYLIGIPWSIGFRLKNGRWPE